MIYKIDKTKEVKKIMIETFSFGRMLISGKEYHSDLIIFPNGRIQNPWWRIKGHMLFFEDIEELISTRPSTIIAGTGTMGLMKPDQGLEKLLQKKGIIFIAESTKKAVEKYNGLYARGDTGACFHVGC